MHAYAMRPYNMAARFHYTYFQWRHFTRCNLCESYRCQQTEHAYYPIGMPLVNKKGRGYQSEKKF